MTDASSMRCKLQYIDTISMNKLRNCSLNGLRIWRHFPYKVDTLSTVPMPKFIRPYRKKTIFISKQYYLHVDNEWEREVLLCSEDGREGEPDTGWQRAVRQPDLKELLLRHRGYRHLKT